MWKENKKLKRKSSFYLCKHWHSFSLCSGLFPSSSEANASVNFNFSFLRMIFSPLKTITRTLTLKFPLTTHHHKKCKIKISTDDHHKKCQIKIFINNHHKLFKDCLPYLFHRFRNKYFNKISLDNMLYFQNKLYKFWETAWFFNKYAMKIFFRIKCKLPFSSWPVRISILTTCVMWSCIGNFLIHARDCGVWINYFCPMRQFRSRSEIVLKFIVFLSVKLVLTNIIL